jgi:hypothetical protein
LQRSVDAQVSLAGEFLISGTIKTNAANESFAGSRGDKAVSFEEWVFVFTLVIGMFD